MAIDPIGFTADNAPTGDWLADARDITANTLSAWDEMKAAHHAARAKRRAIRPHTQTHKRKRAMEFYANQTHGTTGVYVDGIARETFPYDYEQEQRTIAAMTTEHGYVFVERVIFGYGRTALVFRTPIT